MAKLSDKTKSALFEFLRALLAAIVAFVTALLSTGCGSTTKALINNRAEGVTTTVTIRTENPTQITVSPDTDADVLTK